MALQVTNRSLCMESILEEEKDLQTKYCKVEEITKSRCSAKEIFGGYLITSKNQEASLFERSIGSRMIMNNHFFLNGTSADLYCNRDGENSSKKFHLPRKVVFKTSLETRILQNHGDLSVVDFTIDLKTDMSDTSDNSVFYTQTVSDLLLSLICLLLSISLIITAFFILKCKINRYKGVPIEYGNSDV